MSQILETIKTRRSARAYKDVQVAKQDLEAILTAGLYAPSANNTQNWQFTVVQGEEKLTKLQKAVAKALENIFLAAHSLGVDSVWINQLTDTYSDPDLRAVLTEFGVPADHQVCGCAALGYAANPLPSDRENKGKIVYA